MIALHTVRAEALAAAELLLAARQHDVATISEADERCRSFDLNELLDTWSPGWSEQPPPQGMGPMSRRLDAVTYCVFVGVWETGAGFLLEHPDRLHPKSVFMTFARHAPVEGPRAYLTVQGPKTRVLVAFPRLPPVLLAPARSASFRDARVAVEQLIDVMLSASTSLRRRLSWSTTRHS